ncbi:TetR/AcrR family transcriptional regulator [Bacillus timonensis]|nr:TetR/AcrR family transcriptional regulator [Bacillus timonensis]
MTKRKITQEVIVTIASEIIDVEGYHQLSLAALASRLGIKTPSLYNHIGGLDDLKRKLALVGITKLKEAMVHASIGKSGKEAVKSIAFAYVHFVKNHPGLYEATMPSQEIMDNEIKSASGEIVDVMLKILQEYNLDYEKAIHTVRGLRCLVHGFSTLEINKGFMMDVNIEESLTILLETYMAGFISEIKNEV